MTPIPNTSSRHSLPQIAGSILTAPEVSSYQSVEMYYTLQLEIDQILAVGVDCAINLNGKGLLGSTLTDSMALPGEVAAESSSATSLS